LAQAAFHWLVDSGGPFQSHPLRATHLTSAPLPVNCCSSDAPAHDHIGFGLP
jgi:hypothetical protein